MKRLSTLAIGSLAAFGVSSWVYESWVIRELSRINAVPTWWWFGTYLPVIAIISAADTVAHSLRKVPTYSLAVFVPYTLVQVVRGLIAGAPVTHRAEASG